MNHSYKILDAKIEHDHAGNTDFLKVEAQVYLGEDAVGDPRCFGFALDIEEAAIRAELDRFVAVLDSDAENTARHADFEARQEAAKATINALLKKDGDESDEKSPKKRGSKKQS